MTRKKKPLWQSPWKYKESIIFLLGLLVIGILLQLIAGEFPYSILIYPVNLYCGIFIILGLILFSFRSTSQVYQWISGIPFSVTIIGFLLILTLIMGITPQLSFSGETEHQDWISKLGFRNMTSSWPFVILYFFTLFSLGSLIIRRIKKFSWQDYAFYLNHVGLWIILFFAGLGATDIRRFEMHVEEGKTEWRVYNKNDEVLELPIAIQLNDFYMEEYEPKLVIIDKKGTPLPQKNPVYFQIDKKHPVGTLAEGYEISVKKYIHDAMRKGDSYEAIKMTGSCPAAFVTAKNKKTGKITEGWVSSGSPYILYQSLNLTDNLLLVMTQPEPKKFVSDIVAYTKPKAEKEEGKNIPYKLEVNYPLKIDDWTIYQYSYDTKAGKLSTYSSFELVYDPWVHYVYAGMVLLACGCICLLWKGNKKNKNYDLG